MITNRAAVKVMGDLYTITGEGEPTTATVGTLGDIYVDIDEDSLTFGNSYVLTAISEGSYTWTRDMTYDTKIDYAIMRAHRDYLRIRGKPFDESGYPDGAEIVAAEMACYVAGIYEGRGVDSEGVADRSKGYEKKVAGYPASIVAQIDKFVGVA